MWRLFISNEQRQRMRKRASRVKRRIILRIAMGIASALTLWVGIFLWRPSYALPLPPIQGKEDLRATPSSLILDRQGRLIYEIISPQQGMHRPVPLSEIPLALQQAVIATEDASFYENPGIDLRGILRAVWINLRYGQVVSGGSTITQQLARTLFLSPEERARQSVWRKVQEAVLAYYLTRSLGKEAILERYLNTIYFGNMAYGAEAAARAYFGKPVSQLDLAECTLLAGLPQAPGAYNPLTNLEAAKARQKTVLGLMVKAGYMTPQEADLAYYEPLHFASTPFPIEAPHFAMLVRQQTAEILGEEALERGGLRIHTTLDLDLQRQAEAHLRRHLAALNKPSAQSEGHNARNAAALVLDPRDGAVLAMVGSPDYFDATIDGAVNAVFALRQPGSALKPFTYAAAFEMGYSPASVLADVRTVFLTKEGAPYVPVNYDRRYHGPVSLREALASSYNVVAVKLLDRIGLERLPEMARRVGITSLNDADRLGLAMTLGGVEVSLWELTRAYAILAAGGRWVEPQTIAFIEDAQGQRLYTAPATLERQVLDERIAYLITDILADKQARVPGFGEGSALELPFPAAVKTGTTSAWRDNWTVGYTRERVVGVWVGNANNTPMRNVSGVTGAAPIWNAIMQSAHAQPPAPFREPEGLVHVTVCTESGLLPSSACPHLREEVFLAENAPHEVCSMHRFVAFDAASGAPAGPETPPERRLLRRITLWPDELRPWAEENGLLSPWEGYALAEKSQSPAPTEAGTEPRFAEMQSPLRLTSPDPYSIFILSEDIPKDVQKLEIAVLASASLRWRYIALLVNGQEWHRWEAPPYRLLWPLQEGDYILTAVGETAQGETFQSSPVPIRITLPRTEKG